MNQKTLNDETDEKELDPDRYERKKNIPLSIYLEETDNLGVERDDIKRMEYDAGHMQMLRKEGMAYKNRPVIWILNNSFHCVSQAPAAFYLEDIKMIPKMSYANVMP